MARVVIFGLLDTAELAHFYLTRDSEHEVVAFSVTAEHLRRVSFQGLPVVPFEDVETRYPPGPYRFFVPMTARDMNRRRESIYRQAKQKGYDLITYVSSRATVFPGTAIGENCFILEDNTIQPFTSIGNNVVLWSGNHIGHHSVIKDHVFVASHVVVSGHCVVEPYCFFGVNSTIRDQLHVAEGCLIGMDSSVTMDTEPWSVYTGVPARKKLVPSTEAGI